MNRVRSFVGAVGFDQFAEFIGMDEEERKLRRQTLSESFMPFQVTEFYASLIRQQSDPDRTQLLNIVCPPPGKRAFVGRFDPYGNKTYRSDDRAFLQHKYPKTLLLHIDNFCISNCQFCYKVNEIRIEKPPGDSLEKKIAMARDYLSIHPEVDNVLFTGGDPAAFRRTDQLVRLIETLINVQSIRIVRFATKGLAYDPLRFEDRDLLGFFRSVNQLEGKQISVIAQINHPAEVSDEAIAALHGLRDAAVQVRGQPALISGVNDTADVLVRLQRSFLDHQVISYYMTVFMPVRGVEQYGIALHEAFRMVAEAKRQLNGLEKKGVLLASHDFGKLEIVGFEPSPETPKRIVLKWHQAAISRYLPKSLRNSVGTEPEDVMILDYDVNMYCIDHVFKANGLPYFNEFGVLQEDSQEGRVTI